MIPEEIAGRLLQPLWRGIASEYKRKYSLSIWQQFEDNIRSAAYTSNLGKFYDVLCRKLGIETQKGDTEMLAGFFAQVAEQGSERVILKQLREETALLVLHVRVVNEESKQAKAEARAAKQNPIAV